MKNSNYGRYTCRPGKQINEDVVKWKKARKRQLLLSSGLLGASVSLLCGVTFDNKPKLIGVGLLSLASGYFAGAIEDVIDQVGEQILWSHSQHELNKTQQTLNATMVSRMNNIEGIIEDDVLDIDDDFWDK